MSHTLEPLFRTLAAQIVWLVALSVLFVPLELLFSIKRQSIRRPGLLADIGYFFLSGLIPALVFAVPLALVTQFSRHIIPDGYFTFVASIPFAVQVILGLIVNEIGFYWSHRAMHAHPALWQFHAIHHDPERMDWLINSRMHPLDLILTHMAGLTLVYMVGLATPGGVSNTKLLIIVTFVGIVWSFFIHANIRWPMGWIEHLLSTPRFHHWHHSKIDHPNHNYASMLPIFDRLFGTLHMPRGAWPPSYGIAPEDDGGEEREAGSPADTEERGAKTA